jgi:cytidyltransferase-like protein
MKIVLVTGGFDPVHSGHIEYFRAAKSLGDRLIVGINSDEWLQRKKGQPFMSLTERRTIVGNLKDVDATITFDDSDGSSCAAIYQLLKDCNSTDEIIFANGGDRTKENIPEMMVDDTRVKFVFGVGGTDKLNSSSWILQDWKSPKTDRPWGYYRVLHTVGSEVKLKELTVNPGQNLSMQRHKNRSEFWFVAQGQGQVYTINKSTDTDLKTNLEIFDTTFIDQQEWHQLVNKTDAPLKIIEIQFGTECEEQDIERKL